MFEENASYLTSGEARKVSGRLSSARWLDVNRQLHSGRWQDPAHAIPSPDHGD